jgi:hypothetical protein
VTLRILVTGSRDWTDRDTIRHALIDAALGARMDLYQVTVVHGAARGADRIAGEIAREYGCRVEEHPAQWQDGPSAGPRRNAHMVALGADLCLAFPHGESRGTRDCMRRAQAAGIPVHDHGTPASVRSRP